MVLTRKQQIFCLSHQKVWTTRQALYSYRNRQPEPLRKSPSLQEPILLFKLVWDSSEQLRCVAYSALIVGRTIALLWSGRLCLHKKTFQYLGRSDYQCPPGAQNSYWRSKKFLFRVVRPRGLKFWRESKINWRYSWRCLLSRQVMFQQRKKRLRWRLCSNSEIHWWLWKVWYLVNWAQCSFYLTRACKDVKNIQNTFFLCWKRWT